MENQYLEYIAEALKKLLALTQKDLKHMRPCVIRLVCSLPLQWLFRSFVFLMFETLSCTVPEFLVRGLRVPIILLPNKSTVSLCKYWVSQKKFPIFENS